MNRRPLLFVLVAAAVGACGPVLRDVAFQAWCGDTLCHWDTTGEIEQAPSWHDSDFAVRLASVGSSISQTERRDLVLPIPDDAQLSRDEIQELCEDLGGELVGNACAAPVGGSSRNVCRRFEVLADVSADAQVFLELDYGDDGIVDYEQPIAATSWRPVSFLLPLPGWATVTRYSIRKRADGRALLAQFGVFSDSECAGAVQVDERHLGAFCSDDEQCASGICADVGDRTACSECATDDECGADEVCDLLLDVDAVPGGVHRACQPSP